MADVLSMLLLLTSTVKHVYMMFSKGRHGLEYSKNSLELDVVGLPVIPTLGGRDREAEKLVWVCMPELKVFMRGIYTGHRKHRSNDHIPCPKQWQLL